MSILIVSDIRVGDLLTMTGRESELVTEISCYSREGILQPYVKILSITMDENSVPINDGDNFLFCDSKYNESLDGWVIARRNVIIDYDLGI